MKLQDESTESRFSCVVSKKVSPKAVARNRIKRRCREALRPLIKKDGAAALFTFTAKREALSASFDDIKGDVRELLSRVS